MKILRYPDPGLSTRCTPVTVFDDGLSAFAADLLATMRTAPGVGITAAHVGTFVRLFVLDLPDWPQPLYYVNPVILEASVETIRHMEGSVSMPGATEEVERPRRIRFSYQDIQGLSHETEAQDFHAVCIQHEIDQLDGIFWLKRLSRLKRERLVRRWEKEELRRAIG
ncbi:peptide deformylase [Neorhizobium lilium]|nr:peptide deformylase [Neorhizobium lilium]